MKTGVQYQYLLNEAAVPVVVLINKDVFTLNSKHVLQSDSHEEMQEKPSQIRAACRVPQA